MVYNWKALEICVSWTTMDPGVTHSDCSNTTVSSEDLAVGNSIRYTDPSGILPVIKVKCMDSNSVVIIVGDSEYCLSIGKAVHLASGGINYTNFDLSAYLLPTEAYLSDVSSIKYSYQIRTLNKFQVDAISKREDPEGMYIYAQWLWFVNPEPDSIEKAKELFTCLADMGNADASVFLASMYRLGEMGGCIDFDVYAKMVDDAFAKGSELAKRRKLIDKFYGIGQLANQEEAIEETKHYIDALEAPDPVWYNDYANFLFLHGDKAASEEYFKKAIDCGYIDSYIGVPTNAQNIVAGEKAGCALSFVLDAWEMSKTYDSQLNSVKLSIHDGIDYCLHKAIDMNAAEGAHMLGMCYYDGSYGYKKDEEKAWEYFMLGARLGNGYCMSMLSIMIEEALAPYEYTYEDCCFYELRALRYGDDSALENVIDKYREGELQEYADEIERYYLPRYLQQQAEASDDEYDEDDGRWDAYA